MIQLIAQNNPEDYSKVIYDNFSWSTYYHLTHMRKNILNWYSFDSQASILEIGCGLGAITNMLCERCKSVTAVELSKKRATATLLRCRERENLEIIVGNLNDIKFKEKFDYITLIGVLEYQGQYTNTENSYVDFLNTVKKLLKPNGKLLIAIENKYGLKYWCGAREDHTGIPFDSINQYGIGNKNAKNTLLIGGAAYTYPMHYLNKYSDKNIDVVEIDDKMTKIAEKEFGLNLNDERIKVYSQDGRSFFNYSKNKYDTILIDAFKGLNAPFELTTYEALENAKTLLNDIGLVITNIISGIEGKESDFLKYEYATYKAVFDDVKLFKVKDIRTTEESQNLILVGIKGKLSVDDERKNEYSYLLDREITGFESDKKVVTDDLAPIGN